MVHQGISKSRNNDPYDSRNYEWDEEDIDLKALLLFKATLKLSTLNRLVTFKIPHHYLLNKRPPLKYHQ